MLIGQGNLSILRDKTKNDKLVNIPIDEKQN